MMALETSNKTKLTKEIIDLIFHGFNNDLGNNIGVYDTSKEEKIRDNEDELKQQILSALKLQELAKERIISGDKFDLARDVTRALKFLVKESEK